MVFSEFIAAAFIAFYAMIGSAFIGAAITAPRNCLAALSMMWSSAVELGILAIGFCFLGMLAMLLTPQDFSGPPGGPFFLVAAAHGALFGLLFAAKRLARAVIEHEERGPKDQPNKSTD